MERYFLAGHGNLCSALNGSVINDASECSDAANLIGKIFGREASNEGLPGGCFLFTPTNSNSPIKPYGLYVYYNNFDHEVISPSANLLCKKTKGMNISNIYEIYMLLRNDHFDGSWIVFRNLEIF